jgi:hypothetical protein
MTYLACGDLGRVSFLKVCFPMNGLSIAVTTIKRIFKDDCNTTRDVLLLILK